MELIRDLVGEFSDRLSHNCFLAGGSVRDHLMGRRPKDFDLFVPIRGYRKFSLKDETALHSPSLEGLEVVESEGGHSYEPFLIKTVRWRGHDVQIMATPYKSLTELLSTFDWNVSLFGFNGTTILAKERVENIRPGATLKLQGVTYAKSTLRRGFRFSERFQMGISNSDLKHLCQLVVASCPEN